MIQLIVTMNKNTKVHIRLEEDTYRVLAQRAAKLGLTISAYMRMVLKERANGIGKEEE